MIYATIDNTVDRTFAQEVLKVNIFTSIYTHKNSHAIAFMPDKRHRYQFTLNPNCADANVYRKYINKCSSFHKLGLSNDDSDTAREIAIVYQLYYDTVPYTEYEDMLWKADSTTLKEIAKYVGMPIEGELKSKLNDHGYDEAIAHIEIVNALLEVGKIDNCLPRTPGYALMLKFRDESFPSDWSRLGVLNRIGV